MAKARLCKGLVDTAEAVPFQAENVNKVSFAEAWSLRSRN